MFNRTVVKLDNDFVSSLEYFHGVKLEKGNDK
jgi:hypothetical protein